MPKFQFFIRNVYGVQKIYPANGLAEQFADLLNVKTFSRNQIDQIEDLGFDAELVMDPRTLSIAGGLVSPTGGETA